MKRLTTDYPENNTGILLNYAYAKDGRVVLRYGDQEDNIDLCEYMERMCRIKNCEPTAEEIMENGLECECSLSVLYAVATQAAELRARLMQFEDLGHTPEELRAKLATLEEYHKVADPLLRAKAEERLYEIPCKPGDTVHFAAWFGTDPHIVKRVIEPYFYTDDARGGRSTADFSLRDFGKSVFHTREEAEEVMRNGADT